MVSIRTIIGLEIHVQLRTQTKLFCGCPVRFDAPPNSCICAVCLGQPGSLPVLNRRALELSVLTGLALQCDIARRTKWDRKSYYYPDLPKNYQISQYDTPVASNGWFDIPVDGGLKRVRIRRAHLEEDAGKNIHDVSGCTLVDLNRTGTPLLEIVTEPDLESADDAYTFCTELQRLVRYLGVSEASMQKGQMRFEPNVNLAIAHDGEEVRTPIAEIKNLNSFRSVRDAVSYEIDRQFDAWRRNPDFRLGRAENENRGWNAERGVTEFQRSKEAAHDYRYFPDPDLVPADICDSQLDDIKAGLKELPVTRRMRLVNQLGLSPKDAETIAGDRASADLFEDVVARGAPPETAAKQFVNVWLSLANERSTTITELGVDAERMAALASLVREGTVSKTAANRLAALLVDRTESPIALAEEFGLVQVRDAAATESWVRQAFAANEQAVRHALANPKKAKAATGFLRGQVMKLSGGKADPKLVAEQIDRRLQRMKNVSG